MSDPFDDIALSAAINILRDSIEGGRMPSGLPLPADAADLHAQAANHLEATRSALNPFHASTTGEGLDVNLSPAVAERSLGPGAVRQTRRAQRIPRDRPDGRGSLWHAGRG